MIRIPALLHSGHDPVPPYFILFRTLTLVRRKKAVSYTALLVMLLACSDAAFAQRSCKARTRSGKTGVSAAPPTVVIQITDETAGKVVTYEKEFRLDHIPPNQRDQYVEDLIDKLTGGEEDGFVWKNKAPASRNRIAAGKGRTAYAPQGKRRK